MTRKKPKFGALPVLNMPKKRHHRAEPTKPRAARSVVREENQKPESRGDAIYKNFLDLCRRITGLKSLKEWDVKAQEF